jgi:hypothetical protein
MRSPESGIGIFRLLVICIGDGLCDAAIYLFRTYLKPEVAAERTPNDAKDVTIDLDPHTAAAVEIRAE